MKSVAATEVEPRSGATAAAYLSRQPEATPALQVEGLSVSFGRRQVLADVDLVVRRGEVASILGPNGAGKSTLMRAVLGLVPRHSGVVRVGDSLLTRRTRSDIGYVPQRQTFAWEYPLSVFDAVLSARAGAAPWWHRAGAEDYEAVQHALDRLDLADLGDRTVGELSGGQRQRVLIARALCLGPQVLLLDEPGTGLDVPAQASLMNLLQALALDGEAVLMTTHDVLGAMELSDVVHLVRGRVRASGPPRELTDAALWCETFEVDAGSPLVRAVGALQW